jgi:polyadenylate-binding protein
MADRLYVRGFPNTYTAADLKSKFSVYGRVKKAYVVSNDSRCHGIVRYYNPDHATKAIEALNNQVNDGITWYIAHCEKKGIRQRKFLTERRNRKKTNYLKTIFLKDLPQDCSEEKLKEIFEKYGKVSTVNIKENKAFLTFEAASSAEDANKQEKLLTIDGTKVYVNKLVIKTRITRLISSKKLKKAGQESKPINNEDLEEEEEDEGGLFD